MWVSVWAGEGKVPGPLGKVLPAQPGEPHLPAGVWLAPGENLRLAFIVRAPGGEPEIVVNLEEGILLPAESSRRWCHGMMRRASLALVPTDGLRRTEPSPLLLTLQKTHVPGWLKGQSKAMDGLWPGGASDHWA